jgi:periplasmic divalent cation tolerance protein
MYCKVRIGAPTKEQANNISKTLVEKRLVAGTFISKGNCHYWWDNKVNEKAYWNTEAFSIIKCKENIIEEVRKIHSDEVPIIAFNEIDGNTEFLKWIEDSLK